MPHAHEAIRLLNTVGTPAPLTLAFYFDNSAAGKVDHVDPWLHMVDGVSINEVAGGIFKRDMDADVVRPGNHLVKTGQSYAFSG